MTRVRHLARAVSSALIVVVLVLVPAVAAAASTLPARPVAQAPTDPGPSQPHPVPAPTPGPPPVPGPGHTQEPPTPRHPHPAPLTPAGLPPPSGLMPPACKVEGFSCDDATFGIGDLLDVPGLVVNAISGFLGTLLEQVIKPVRELLADTLLATPDVTRQPDVRRLWSAVLGIAGAVYVLFVTAGGITVMGYETVQARYSLKQIAPRLLLGMAAAATSLTVMRKAIDLSNALAHSIMATDLSDAARGTVERILPFASPGAKLYLQFLALIAVCLVLATLIGFFVRTAVMALLAVCAPLALACHAHPMTDPIARLWWRALAGCLIIQVAQSMTFVLGVKLFFAPGAVALGLPKADQLGSSLAGLALFWVLFKIPGWALQIILRGSPAGHLRAPAGVRMLKSLAMYRLMGSYLPSRFPSGRRSAGGNPGPGRGSGGLAPPARGPGGGGPGRGGGAPGDGRGGHPPGQGSGNGPRPSGLGGTAVAAPVGNPPAPGPTGAAPVRRARMATAPTPAARVAPGPSGMRRQSPPGRGAALGLRAPRVPTAATRPVPARRAERPPASATNRPDPGARPSRPARHEQPGRHAQSTSPSPPAARPTPAPRTRQLTLPIPAERVRPRPPRPMQLRLPLEQPRRNSP